MFFSDAIGNKDTITLGYDNLATDSIDATFGETNIISLPLDTTLDVRVTNEWRRRFYYGLPGTFHTKKQILFYNCHDYLLIPNISEIDIHTKHWPVTVTWDSLLFNDTCRNGSVFTSVNPGGWFDTGSPSNLWRKELMLNDSATFTTNNSGSGNDWYSYINNGGDTIPIFWQVFADSTLFYLSTNDITNIQQKIKVFPNPTTQNISVQTTQQFGNILSIDIMTLLGQLVLTSQSTSNIDLSHLDNGIYIMTVTNAKGDRLVTRILKE